jgi:glucose-6-phosphate isomerase
MAESSDRTPTRLRETSAWRRLEWHLADIRHAHLRELFAGDPSRGERLVADAAGLSLDYSKNLLTNETLELLRKLAVERGFRDRLGALSRGGPEDSQAGLHVALRLPRSRSIVVGGVDVVKQANEELDRVCAVADRVRAGSWLGATGKPVRAVVNIGTRQGGLGPELAYAALRANTTGELVGRFVSSPDPAALSAALDGLDAAETVFVVVAKELSRATMLTNVRSAQAWLRDSLGRDASLERHLLVVAATPEAASALGVPAENVLRIPEWLDESRSLCSAAALSACISLGPDAFRELLVGFRAMDEHFASSPLGGNVPAIHGFVAIWYRNFLDAQTAAVVPYAHSLSLLPAYVQELSMGSGGKSVTISGDPVEVETGPVVWGDTAPTGDSGVLRLLQQGTVFCPLDLIAFACPQDGAGEQHDLLVAGLLALGEALAFGRSPEELEDAGVETETIPYRALPGNRPSSVILARSPTPATLGALLALYEHSVFTQASLWELDPVAGAGGEYAEELASRIVPELGAGWKRELMHDSSTNALIRRYRHLRDARD